MVDGTLGGDQILALWATSFVAVVALRVVARWAGSRAVPAERCLVIGEPARADRIRQKLASSGARATVVATFGLEGEDDIHPLDPSSVRTIVKDLQVHRIILAPTTAESRGVVDLIRIAKGAGARVSVLPRMLEVVGSAVEFDDVDGMTVLGVRQFGLSRSSRTLKRAFDIVVTSIGLRRGRPDPRRPGDRDPARHARADLLPPGPDRPRRRAVRDLQVPLDGDRRRRAQGRAPRAERGRRRHVQDQRRSAGHARRALPAPAPRSTSCRSCSTCCAAR